MSNKLIVDLTNRLIEALDQNYDVVNMDTVLAVISALEGATITKEQLETTRLAKHINQLRRRNKSNILAIRAKNLLKKWREMFGITSQAQSEAGGASTGGTSTVTQQATSAQHPVSKQVVSSTSQPASPNTNTQLLGENFDNSLSSIGVDFSRTTPTSTTPLAGGNSGSISNTASANFKFNKKSLTVAGADAAAMGSRSNGALGKSTNRNITNNSSPATIVNATTVKKVNHPTSFKNLITGINVHNAPKQANSSALSPKVLPPIPAVSNERKMFIIDDQSQPSSSTAGASGVPKTTVDGVSSPRTHKSMKRKERNSPVVMTFMDHSSSPTAFENLSHEPTTITTGRFSAPQHPSARNQIITSTIDLHDSNSSSNFGGVTEVVSSTTTTTGISSSKVNGGGAVGISSNSSSNKRIRKDKKRSNERIVLVTEAEHFQPTIDESSRIAFPISGIQEYLSLSNSSMSIFPAGSGVGGGSGTERFQSAANEDNQLADSSTGRNKPDGDLTFAGKFKLNSAGGIDVESSSSYYKGGGTAVAVAGGENNISVISSGVDGSGNGVPINNNRDLVNSRSVSAIATRTAEFLPFSRNSNESSSNSRTSQLDLIDVVNQDSQSMINFDDLRQLQQQKQSSNEKQTPQDIKFPKNVLNNASKPQQQHLSSKEHNTKSLLLNTSASSETSTPNSSVLPIVANANVSLPPAVEQKVPKKRGRKKGSKGIDSVLAQSAGLNSQFLMSPALGSNKKVKTTRELLFDIQSRKKGSSATSSPTLLNWFGTSRPASSCSEPSLHSPRTSDANSTNATMSTAALSTPEKNASNNSIAADELYESDSDTNTSEPSHENVKPHASMESKKIEADADGSRPTTSTAISSIEEQIKELMAMLPPVDKQKIDWETCEDIPCTCSLREIPPEVQVAVKVDSENTLDLLENVDAIENDEDDEVPVISVSVLPATPQQLQVPGAPLRSSSSPTPILPHYYSQSAPVSTVTSPVVPQTTTTTKKGTTHQILPTKSIFDLDFDDDNDPLHMFVEAASKTKNGIISHYNAQEKNLKENEDQDEDAEKSLQKSTKIKEEHFNIKSQSEQNNRLNKMPTSQQQQAAPPNQQQPEPPDQQMMTLLMNFPTYEVIEDPACEAKQRYEIQTNQITKFHINAFHNCYIPNVNGNWDHSIPENSNVAGDDECLKLENDSLHENVVPKYGCLVKERIPKDLSYIKFTSNYKPNLINKKSDKPPPLPFLGVANIHRCQNFHLYHYHRNLKKKESAEKEKRSRDKKTKKKKKISKSTIKDRAKAKEETLDRNVNDVSLKATTNNITEIATSKKAFESIAIDSTLPITMEIDDTCVKIESESALSPLMIASKEHNLLDDGLNQEEHLCLTIKNRITPSPEEENFKQEPRLDNDQTQQSPHIGDEDDEKIKMSLPLIVNGNVPHLMNNNTIIKNDDDNGPTCQTKIRNNNHHVVMNDAEGIAASRRSSSCSNSSLKQNQNSINMKLRQHRLEHLQLLEKQQLKRKRKHVSALTTDFCEFDADQEVIVVGEDQPLPPKVPPLIKRIKLVNGNYAAEAKCPANSMTDSSCLDDDNDSDCYHVHSENDIITDEEDDQRPDDEDDDDDDDDDFDEVVDDYDEEDGDDDEEDCGDFHEVVTRDMTSSATGNNHIVLTIKKTPSKTNSPSSSSMSPAPVLVQNLNENTKISPPIVHDVALLIDDDDGNNDNLNKKKELGKLLDLNRVKTVDLITKTDFFLPEETNVAIYNFQLKKNGDKDHGDDINGMPPLPIIEENDDEEEEQQQQQHHTDPNVSENAGTIADATDLNQAVSQDENPKKLDESNDNDDEKSKQQNAITKQELLTKSKLSKSIQLTKKYFRRIELKKRLREGIEQANKLHRQLFFPYELHTSNGSKILEINSCTSDCTDPSDDETTDSSDSDTEYTTSSSSGNGNLKSRMMMIKRRRRTKLPTGKRRTVCAGGGGNPPSSSSSSSSSSSDSSSSASAFTSWTTSDDDDDPADKKPNQNINAEVKKEESEVKEEQEFKEEAQQSELPSANNFLLRSFNHIYVSTEERQRQQQLKQASEYRQHHEVGNSGGAGYITLSGDDSKDETTHNEGYLKYFDVNSRYVYDSRSTSANMSGVVQSSSSSSRRQQALLSSSPTTIEDTSVDVETIEQPSSEVVLLVEKDDEAEKKQSTVIMSSEKIDVSASATTENDNNNRINPDSSVGSINININNIENNNRSVQMKDKTEQLETTEMGSAAAVAVETKIEENQNKEDNLVAQEEYRTGIRRVDEDVVDEDGNNCARTQQFKEWHEVLQLRSYNDELLTVLPYVVIE